MSDTEKKSRRGGKRKGAGRKPRYDEPTVTVSVRVPQSKVKKVKLAIVQAMLQ